MHANLLEVPARAKQSTGKSKRRRMQEAFAAHLRHVARIYPAGRHRRVVLILETLRGTGAGPSTTPWPTIPTWSSTDCPAIART